MIDENKLCAEFCIHCGRVYIGMLDDHIDACTCGYEFYPVAKKIQLGKELTLGDGHKVRVEDETDLNEALDFIEAHLYNGHFCSDHDCGCYDGNPHCSECKTAAFLRKHGRKVHIVGDA